MKSVLIYSLNDFPENGGGIFWESAKDEYELEAIVNKFTGIYKDKFVVLFAGVIQKEIKFEAVETVTTYRIKE